MNERVKNTLDDKNLFILNAFISIYRLEIRLVRIENQRINPNIYPTSLFTKKAILRRGKSLEKISLEVLCKDKLMIITKIARIIVKIKALILCLFLLLEIMTPLEKVIL